ncbi:hypothetical protein [Polaribacter sp. R77954]|uniref:hypothetical protein n=1 Tax=Polaribacter sp. R77954 TaxID=3093870 RepID=UPI0037C7F80D
MGNKKLDHLFQENLKNLEVTPNKRVWNNVEAQLVKKKRKIVPFWWFTGVVASILVVVSFFYPFLTTENQNRNTNSNEVITTIPEEKNIISQKKDTLQLDKKSTNDILISREDKLLKTIKKKHFKAKSSKKENAQPQKTKAEAFWLTYNPVKIRTKNLFQNQQLLTLAIKKIQGKPYKLNIANVVKKEEVPEIKKISKNWSVASVFGVLQSNSLTDTSPINSSLASSTSGESSYAYGVQIAYKFSNKWSIQSGVHLQEIGYSNRQIAVNTSSNSNPFATQFTNGAIFSFDANVANSNEMFASDISANTFVANTGNLSQNYGYIEIPLEVKYTFLNHKKINSAIVTGFSTLFLNKNEIVLNTKNFSRNLEAPNLNNINFSGNLGFDLNYTFNPKWSFQVNPMFKIQLNTFTDNANNFAPFNFGLYSGVTYQF